VPPLSSNIPPKVPTSEPPRHYIALTADSPRSRDARAGDQIPRPADSAAILAVDVELLSRSGLCNQQTLQGDFVVNGFVAGTYTTTMVPPFPLVFPAPLSVVYAYLSLSASSLTLGLTPGLPSRRLVSSALAPFRNRALISALWKSPNTVFYIISEEGHAGSPPCVNHSALHSAQTPEHAVLGRLWRSLGPMSPQ
jgi:hypothetical protein